MATQAHRHLAVVSDNGATDSPTPPAVRIKNIEIIENHLKRVEADISALLESLIGNPYAPVIRHISNAESLIKDKSMDKWQPAIAALKVNLVTWKEFFGSTTCALLDTNLKEEASRLKKDYSLTDEQIGDITESILLCTHDLLRKMMKVNKIGDLDTDTKGGINLDTEKRITIVPEAIKSPLGSLKGTIPQLLVVIDMINLMIAKITLLNIRVVLKSMQNLKINVEDILG